MEEMDLKRILDEEEQDLLMSKYKIPTKFKAMTKTGTRTVTDYIHYRRLCEDVVPPVMRVIEDLELDTSRVPEISVTAKDLDIFVKTVQKLSKIKEIELFTGYNQNDLPEFLIFVIDSFHNSLAREVTISIHGTPENDLDKIALLCFEKIKQMYSNDYSEIWNMFYGIHISQLITVDSNEPIVRGCYATTPTLLFFSFKVTKKNSIYIIELPINYDYQKKVNHLEFINKNRITKADISIYPDPRLLGFRIKKFYFSK
jgi:hypothetical protein